MSLIVSCLQGSLVDTLWAHEGIVMYPGDAPRSEIWATVALHVESTDGENGEFVLLHPETISTPEDQWESLLERKQEWLNYSIRQTEGRQIKVRDDGKSLALAHDIRGPLPITTWGGLRYALEPVYPLPIGTRDGAKISLWPEPKLVKEMEERELTLPFTEIRIDVPRKKGRELRICRLRFETRYGIKKAGIAGQFLYAVYGPDEMGRRVLQAIDRLPSNLQELFLRRYREDVKAFRAIQHDVTMFGYPAGHTYIVDWGDEHRPTPMFTIRDPGIPDGTQQVLSFTPTNLNFQLSILAVPASL